ncbi:MAG TPA: LytR C-terminal domain-containing protein [Actinomycetales bacterium]
MSPSPDGSGADAGPAAAGTDRFVHQERTGAHRPRRSPLLDLLPLLLVAVVVLGVGVGVWALSRSTPDTVAASGGPLDPDAAAQDDPSASGSATTTPSPTTTGTPTPTPTSSPTSSPSLPVDRSVPVSVLNATGRGGLAGRVRATLREAGWTASTGNGPTRQAVTTVYYPSSDQEGTAQAVADDLGVTVELDRSREYGSDRITLVLGADFVE